MKELNLRDTNGDIDRMLEEIREKSDEERLHPQPIKVIIKPTKGIWEHIKESATSSDFYKYLFVGLMFTAISLAVYWLFADTFHFKAVYVTAVWIPFSFIIRFLIEKVWVFEK